MVQIGRRGTARRLFENFKKILKITQFEFQNSGPSFFASVSPVYCNKSSAIAEKANRCVCLLYWQTDDIHTFCDLGYLKLIVAVCAKRGKTMVRY